jgi:hypothetical protein
MFLFVIDQSGSTGDPFAGMGTGRSKGEAQGHRAVAECAGCTRLGLSRWQGDSMQQYTDTWQFAEVMGQHGVTEYPA